MGGVVRGAELGGARVVEFVGDFFLRGGAEEAAGAGDVFGADGWICECEMRGRVEGLLTFAVPAGAF